LAAQSQTGLNRSDERVPEEIEGVIEVVQEDSASGSTLRHILQAGGQQVALEVGANLPSLLSGTRVRVRGVREEPLTLNLDSSTSSVTTLAPAPLPDTLGEQRTLVLLVNFRDNASTPYTLNTAENVVFNSGSAYFREVSYGHTWLAGDVYGWFTLEMDSAPCDPARIATLAGEAAVAAGVDVARYTRFVYMFPEIACPWWGRGSVGGSPTNAWVNGYLDYRVVSHELGHNLGLYHAHSLACGTSSITPPCTTAENGDKLDLMGGNWGHYNGFMKERLGWVGSTNHPPVKLIEASGNYWIEPASSAPAGGAKALKVLKSVDSSGQPTSYYIEFRQGTGFDAFLNSSANVLHGVVVHTGSGSDGNTSYLIDMTPETTAWDDVALVVGRTFADPTAGIEITTLSADSSGALVSVNVTAPPPPPAAVAPTISVTTSQATFSRGQVASIAASVRLGTTAAAGASVNFKVTRPNGTSSSGSAVADAYGIARYSMTLRKKDQAGVYNVTAASTVNGMSASASTSFTVK
jgi:hypothetical protein